jgi:hypothetical protein
MDGGGTINIPFVVKAWELYVYGDPRAGVQLW